MLEIKEKGYEYDIYNMVKKFNNENITIISFKYDVLEKLREYSKELNLGWLIYDLNENILNDCKKIKLNQVLTTSVCLNKDEVKKLHDNNFIVTAWGVVNKHDIERLYKLGVDRLIYDSGYMVKKYLKEIKNE